MAQHRKQVLELQDGRFAGTCSCGHATERFVFRTEAVKAINTHVVEASAPPPKTVSEPHGVTKRR